MRDADPILQGALSLDEVAEVAVLLIPDWALEGEQFLSDLDHLACLHAMPSFRAGSRPISLIISRFVRTTC
jgi:hypothetical protein